MFQRVFLTKAHIVKGSNTFVKFCSCLNNKLGLKKKRNIIIHSLSRVLKFRQYQYSEYGWRAKECEKLSSYLM